jgi:hypothetical protein
MTKNVTRKGGAHHPGIVVSGMHVPRPFRLAGRHAQHTNPNNTFRFTHPNVAAVGPARTPFGFGMGAMAPVMAAAVPAPAAARSRSRSRGTKRGKSRSRSGSKTGKKGKKSPSAEL